MKINFGAGKTKWKGWKNIDLDTELQLEHIDNESVDVIYSSHCLGYFDREQAKLLLFEFKRVLKSGGKLFLSVPDFRTIAQLYLEDNIPLHKFLGPLYGKMKIFNGAEYKYDEYHRTVYDYQSLGDLLKFMDFKKIDLWDHEYLDRIYPETRLTFMERNSIKKEVGDCSRAEIDDTLISLNIMAVKK